ncbi:MAG: 30S ribosomal protein S12 methylthiotransferase RimO [Deltaproteobacteria bacterium]|nr:30S ribosomal protein S12 methylthiotransferase RimO [Deltaproteobacteria bacterium]
MGKEKKIYLISLGCAKNIVDSENILGLLQQKGFPIASSLEEAQIAIINTCGFIRPAVEECIDTILELADMKLSGLLEHIVVAGCFVQRYGYKLRREMPEVDAWLGTGEIPMISEVIDGLGRKPPMFLINRPVFIADHDFPRVQTTPFYSAYLKIAEGCSHHCSFCTIPALRGRFRSRDPESLVIEAKGMADRGVKEINLVAQDTTMYGRDLSPGTCLEDLLERLLEVKGLEWIRILYAHPSGVSEHLLDLIEDNERICPYLDIPMQHANKKILEAMGRGPYGEGPADLIKRIRSRKRTISIRTSLMVGFPGETDDAFRELYDFVEMAGFEHMGTFIFSPEPGTRAARLKGMPDPEVSEKRFNAIMSLQKAISLKKNTALINKTVSVLIEGVSPETDLLLTGRTATMAPDVDGQVLINEGNGTVGKIMQVLIREAHPYDLIGRIV